MKAAAGEGVASEVAEACDVDRFCFWAWRTMGSEKGGRNAERLLTRVARRVRMESGEEKAVDARRNEAGAATKAG